MSPRLEPLSAVADLDQVLADSAERPVLVFKHSRHCDLSVGALSELHAHLADPHPGVSYRIITVQSERHVSDAAAVRLGVIHETPQAILVRNGEAVWDASHFDITAETLSAVLQAGTTPGQPLPPSPRRRSWRQ